MSQDRFGALGVDADDIDLTSLKEAFELPDSLPPIRLPSIAELAAQARQAPMAGQLAALAMWVGSGRRVDEEGDLPPPNRDIQEPELDPKRIAEKPSRDSTRRHNVPGAAPDLNGL